MTKDSEKEMLDIRRAKYYLRSWDQLYGKMVRDYNDSGELWTEQVSKHKAGRPDADDTVKYFPEFKVYVWLGWDFVEELLHAGEQHRITKEKLGIKNVTW